MDYDDLLTKWLWLLQNIPEAKERFTQQFHYILVDEYQLYAEKAQDLNRFFVIFSREPLNKPRLTINESTDITEKEAQEGYTVPLSLESEDFQRWLNKNRSFHLADMQVDIIDITITK